MKDTRFIELLNLYVDHQLTPTEAAELEHELAHNPARRRIQQQYCRMQKACISLLENERNQAPLPPKLARALADADRKITTLPEAHTGRHQRAWWAAASTLAAAACAALLAPQILVTKNQSAPLQPASIASTTTLDNNPTAVLARPDDEKIDTHNLLALSAEEVPAQYRILINRAEDQRLHRSIKSSHPFNAQTHLVSATSSIDPSLQWLQDIDLAPIAAESINRPIVIETRPAPRSPKNKPYYGDAKAELTAFQFQK